MEQADYIVVTSGDSERWVPRELVRAVREHAREHYNDGGWDVIVECYEDVQIAELIGRARTPQGAINKVAEVVSVFAERQADAVNSAF